MGRPRNETETKQLSLKLSEELYQRLLETAYNETGAKYPSDVNLSDWLRKTLAQFVDVYATGKKGGSEMLATAYKQARAEELKSALAELESL